METLVAATLGHGRNGDQPSTIPPAAHPDADAPPAAAAGARVLELDVLGAKVAEAKVGAQARDGAPLGDALAVGGLAGAELADGDVVEVLAHGGSDPLNCPTMALGVFGTFDRLELGEGER